MTLPLLSLPGADWFELSRDPALPAILLLVLVLVVGLRRAVLVPRHGSADPPAETTPDPASDAVPGAACRWKIADRPRPGEAAWRCAECGGRTTTDGALSRPAGCRRFTAGGA